MLQMEHFRLAVRVLVLTMLSFLQLHRGRKLTHVYNFCYNQNVFLFVWKQSFPEKLQYSYQCHVIQLLKAVSYTHLRAHETKANLVCRLLLEKKQQKQKLGNMNERCSTAGSPADTIEPIA